jgi:hypothetical protein
MNEMTQEQFDKLKQFTIVFMVVNLQVMKMIKVGAKWLMYYPDFVCKDPFTEAHIPCFTMTDKGRAYFAKEEDARKFRGKLVQAEKAFWGIV